jgi:hypothetical protein
VLQIYYPVFVFWEMLKLCAMVVVCLVPYIHAWNAHPVVGVPRLTWTLRRTATCIGSTLPVCCDKNPPATKPTYLRLHSGQRISRIITVDTDNFDVMMKLGRAKCLSTLLHIALVRHKRKCLLLEHQRLPVVPDCDMLCGQRWRYQPMHGSNMNTNSGSLSSTLWGVDVESFNHFEVEVGSWKLASLRGQDDNHISAIFSRTISRVDTDAQAVSLVRPGCFECANVQLVRTSNGLRWVFTFIETEHCDELGAPTKRQRGTSIRFRYPRTIQ